MSDCVTHCLCIYQTLTYNQLKIILNSGPNRGFREAFAEIVII